LNAHRSWRDAAQIISMPFRRSPSSNGSNGSGRWWLRLGRFRALEGGVLFFIIPIVETVANGSIPA
jgi:hypothetical protein